MEEAKIEKLIEKYSGYKYPYAGVVSEFILEPFAKTVMQVNLHDIYSKKWMVFDMLKGMSDEYIDRINSKSHTDFSLRIENPNNPIESYIGDFDFKMNNGKDIYISPASQDAAENKTNNWENGKYIAPAYIVTLVEHSHDKWHLYVCPYSRIKEYIKDERIELDQFLKLTWDTSKDSQPDEFAGCYYCNWENNMQFKKETEFGHPLNMLCNWTIQVYKDYLNNGLDKRNTVNDGYFPNYLRFCIGTHEMMFK